VLAAPRVARAQGWREAQLWAVGTLSRPAFAGLGAGLAWRDAGRTRIAAALAGGALEGAGPALRAEVVGHFLLDPARTRGDVIYGGGGLAVLLDEHGRLHPYVQLVLGAENAPGGRRGTFLEVGVGGGARLAIGMRWRKHNAPRR
jgi:hypothetical protein